MAELNDSMRDFLNGCHYATLGTINDDGSIHMTTVWYLFENDRFYFVTGSSARKARNCKARPNASVVVDSRRIQGEEKSISTSGSVEIITGDESREINKRIVRRYITEEGINDETVGPVFEVAGEEVICLTPGSWNTYELKSVDDAYFGGVLRKDPQKWFNTID